MNTRRLKSLALFPAFLLLSLVKATGYLLAGKTRDHYCLKSLYWPRRKYLQFDGNVYTDEYQDEVYSEIKRIIEKNRLRSILDIGCGSGYKLMKYFGDYDTLGLEVQPALDFLKKQYPHKRWQFSNLKSSLGEKFDIVVSVDVIEHLTDPDELLTFISGIECRYIVLSSPDRARLSFVNWFGPPANPYHIREWSKKELVDYISKYFDVIDSKIVGRHDHVCVARKKQ